MAKKKCKLLEEFKTFITRGNVMDLAVGMIIGAAFTAIVTAVVNGILKPLINMIPGADGSSALMVQLREPAYDAAGNIVKEAVILDFGAVISAIITFLCTALLLFVIVKVFNTVKAKGEELKAKAEAELEKKHKEEEAAAEEAAPVEEAPAVVEEPKETAEDILKQIRDELAKLNAKE
ncbi:MAG: large conductance mechanosensitive channel protein MscL [Clostridia bacterium]|nr:large conductance mechanosensitive channel protein MscL [Clostridia bacterium]